MRVFKNYLLRKIIWKMCVVIRNILTPNVHHCELCTVQLQKRLLKEIFSNKQISENCELFKSNNCVFNKNLEYDKLTDFETFTSGSAFPLTKLK